jgi:hypothetical protein
MSRTSLSAKLVTLTLALGGLAAVLGGSPWGPN